MLLSCSLVVPVKFSSNVKVVSPMVWLCMDVELQKHISLCIPHCVNIETDEQLKHLKFQKSENYHIGCTETVKTMKVIEGGIFYKDKSKGQMNINHFCYYCITVDNLQCGDIPKDIYKLVTIKEIQPTLQKGCLVWNLHVSIICALETCYKVSYL